MEIGFAVAVFLAGVITFLAPCTLPLVPAYLAFIGGSTISETNVTPQLRWRIVKNSLWYVFGFSLVFVFFGILAGLGGRTLIQYRFPLTQLGGILIILFGLFLLGFVPKQLAVWFNSEQRLSWRYALRPGTSTSSFLFGATFAFGWTPCVGPILGSILLLAATTTTVATGALYLVIFSLGLALPFLLIAVFLAQAFPYLQKIQVVLPTLQRLGGLLLILLGVLLLTDSFGRYIGVFFQWLPVYQTLTTYL